MTINSLNFSTNTMQYDKEIINFKQKANEKHQAKFMDLSGLPNLGYAKNGETTILGKLWGYDKNISKKEVEDLKNLSKSIIKLVDLILEERAFYVI